MEADSSLIRLATGTIEILAAAIIVGSIVVACVRWAVQVFAHVDRAQRGFRALVGRSLQVALELFIASDLIRTVAGDFTLQSVSILAAMIAIRTFLSWSLTVELEGRWPWHPRAAGHAAEDHP